MRVQVRLLLLEVLLRDGSRWRNSGMVLLHCCHRRLLWRVGLLWWVGLLGRKVVWHLRRDGAGLHAEETAFSRSSGCLR